MPHEEAALSTRAISGVNCMDRPWKRKSVTTPPRRGAKSGVSLGLTRSHSKRPFVALLLSNSALPLRRVT